MQWRSDHLSDADIRDLSEYFASLPCAPVRQTSRLTDDPPDKGQRCAYCHGATGANPYDIVPNIAGQKRQYLIDELRRFRDSALEKPQENDHNRFSLMMAPAAYDLTDKEITEFADYYSRQSCKLPR